MNKNLNRDKEIVDMYNDGKTYKEISKYFGFDNVNSPMILTALKRNGIKTNTGRYPLRSRNAKNIDLNFFEEIDSKEKAYILGLIYSDGSIDKDGYGFSFSSKDYEQISLFRNLLKSEHKICEIKSFDHRTNKTYNRYSLHICSKKVTSDLLKIGLANNKSFDCNFPEFSKEFIWHFIRGLFDGDGCITEGKKEGQLSFTQILSGSLYSNIKDFFNECGLNKTKDQIKNSFNNKNIYSIKYSSFKDLKYLYDNIYYDSDGLRLERKFEIFSKLKEYKRGVYKRNLRKIKVFDKEGKFIKEYENINDIGLNRSKIYAAIRNGSHYKGFLFRYNN
jgi:hypothetical protein